MKTEAKDWYFMSHDPDAEDLEAKMRSMGHYFKSVEDIGEPLTNVNTFTAGFYRGMQWAINKYGLKNENV